MDTQPRPTGIEEVGDRPWGTHFCLFYETREDLLDLLIPYFQAGLEGHEFCLYVASEPVMAEEAVRALRGTVPSFERYLADGQIEIISHLDWYLTGGRFDPLRVRQGWIDKLDQGLAHGYAGMRFAANIFWLENQDWVSFGEYEGQLDEVFGQLRIMAVCAYALENRSAIDMLDVVQHHQFTVARRHGAWERLEGPELYRAFAEIRKANADLERQVEARTAQLVGTNELLILKDEISERQPSEAAPRQSDVHFRLVINTIPALVWSAQPDGSVDFINQRHQEFTGLSLDDVRGWRWTALIHPEDRPQLVAQWRRALVTGEPVEAEARLRRAVGDYRWLLIRAVPLRDESGKIVRWYGTKNDIEDRQQAAQALQKSERVLREAESLGHTGSWEHNLVTGEIFNTDENLRLFFGDDLSKGGPFEDYSQAVHPDDREYVMRGHAQLLAEGGPSDIEFRVVWPDGSVHVLLGRATIVRDELGHAIRVNGTNLEITERKQAEEALRRSEADYRALADNSVQGITIFQDQRIVYANPAVSRMFGYTSEEFQSMSLEQIIALTHPLDRAMAEERARQRMQGQTLSPSIEGRVLRKDGSTGWVQAFNSLIDYHGRSAILTTTLDITERKEAEEEIRRHTARMEALAGISQALAHVSLDVQAVLEALVRHTAEVTGDGVVILLLSSDGQWLRPVAFHHPQPEVKALMTSWFSGRPVSAGHELFARVLRTGEGLLIPAMDQEPLIQMLPLEYQQYIERIGIRSSLLVPLRAEGRVMGILCLGRNQTGQPYTLDDQVLVQDLAERASLTIQNARLFQSVNEQRAQLSRLSAQLTDAQEAERRAVARELHDEIGQQLYAIGANLEFVRLSPDAATLTERLAESAALVDQAIQQVRDLALELRPSMLDDFGLVPALTWLVERQAQRSGFQADFTAAPPDLRLPARLETAVYRIVQIALTNVGRHAQARYVTINVHAQGSELELSIKDDGVGFDVAAALEGAKQGATLGLMSMQERVRLVGGTLEINSAPGQGTSILATLPIDEPGGQ